MNFQSDCGFCDIVNGHYRYPKVDKPLAMNDDFIAIASIGALIEGWTMILPKEHHCSMRSFYKKSSLRSIANRITENLYKAYGELIVFEHGANKNGSPTGCGIDHAHLHFVPSRGSLLPEMKSLSIDWIETTASNILSLVGDHEYLFYTELNSKETWYDPIGYLHILESPTSQFFRKLIAKQVGTMDEADYKAFPKLEVAESTIGTFYNMYPNL